MASPPRSTVFVTRTRMRRLAPVELLLKQTAVGGQEGAPSVLEGAVVRVLIDKVRWRGSVIVFWCAPLCFDAPGCYGVHSCWRDSGAC